MSLPHSFFIGKGGGDAAIFSFTSMTFLATTGTTYHPNDTEYVANARVFEESPYVADYIQNYDTNANPWLNDSSMFSLIRPGFQKFTIPETGNYIFRCAGGAGVNTSSAIGNSPQKGMGAIIQAEFALTKGDYIQIMVGKQTNHRGSGGSASFVADSSGNPLVIAGGGGSVWQDTDSYTYSDAPNSTYGNRSSDLDIYATNGQGGYQDGGSYGAGAGWYSDTSTTSLNSARRSARLKDDARGGGYANPNEQYKGSFGGAGGAISGGAGYSGGTGATGSYRQGGGGSFISASCTGNNVGTITGNNLGRTGSEPDAVYPGNGIALGRNTANYLYVTVTKS